MLNESAEKQCFAEAVAPRLGPGVEYVGEADATLEPKLFGQAACLASPIQWEEPFGMVRAEAMACGTPVVAIGRGSVPEVVEDGVNGIVVHSVEDFAAAVERAVLLRPVPPTG